MGIGWLEYDEVIDNATEELDAEDDLLKQVLTTHREAFSPDPSAGSATEKFMAELLDNAPDLNLFELLAGETFVKWDDGYSRFEGTFTAEELVAQLDEADLLVDRFRNVEDNFLRAAERYEQVTKDYFGGELWDEQQINNELGRNFRLREEFASAQPNRILPALEEHDERAFNRVMNLTPPGDKGEVTNNLVDEVVRQRDRYRDLKDQPTGTDAGTRFREQAGASRFTPPSRTGAPNDPRPAPFDPVTRAPSETNMPVGQAMPGGGFASFQEGLGRLKGVDPQSSAGQAIQRYYSGDQETEQTSEEEQLAALLDAGLSIDEALAVLDSRSPSTPSGPGRPSLAEIQAADRAEVEEFLRTQFGGFEFFLDKHASDLQVGLTADGLITAADDPTAVTAKNVLDVIVEQGLTDPARIEGALSNTKWWQETDAQARVFDVTYANLNDLERLEYVEPTMDLIREELQFLGAEMSDADRQQLAADLMRLGDESDTETVRDMLIDRLGEAFDPGAQSISDFSAARDEIEALSRKYFVPIDTVAAGTFAEEIYLGQRSATEMEQYFKEHALSKFPTLENAIKNGFTPEEYFAPYKYEIEKMLGRPNINLYDEFADVIEYFPDTGGETPRPMTMHEVRKYVRGLPEWQQSDAGRASAEALAFAIGKTFGEVA